MWMTFSHYIVCNAGVKVHVREPYEQKLTKVQTIQPFVIFLSVADPGGGPTVHRTTPCQCQKKKFQSMGIPNRCIGLSL